MIYYGEVKAWKTKEKGWGGPTPSSIFISCKKKKQAGTELCQAQRD